MCEMPYNTNYILKLFFVFLTLEINKVTNVVTSIGVQHNGSYTIRS